MPCLLRSRLPSVPTAIINDGLAVCRRVPEGGESVREVRISCPDATGLGCDVSRMLLDFGLRILSGDLSTDGTWCFLVFVVRLKPYPETLGRCLKLKCMDGYSQAGDSLFA